MSIKFVKKYHDASTQQEKKLGHQLLAHANKTGNEVVKEHLNKEAAKATGDLVEFKIAEKITPLKTSLKLQQLSV